VLLFLKRDKSLARAFIVGLGLVIIMWMSYWADFLFITDFHKYGVLPKNIEGLRGIFFMPFIHAHNDIHHIINNSLPTLILTTLLFYSYREIAIKVFLYSWFFTGALLWIIAKNTGSYNIGMSGLIYALTAFLFTSGTFRRHLPLQGLSLFVVFIYGSLVWGIFPIKEHVSWQGHLAGLITGVVLAIIFRKDGPQRPKYQYEIEKELGIEPPDLEGEYWAKVRAFEEQQRLREEQIAASQQREQTTEIKIIYDFKPKESLDKKQQS
jgi:membrane associated rhomboid family serine protease